MVQQILVKTAQCPVLDNSVGPFWICHKSMTRRHLSKLHRYAMFVSYPRTEPGYLHIAVAAGATAVKAI